MRIDIKTYAKLNLTLDVLFKRDDGYHELDTIMHSISLSNLVSISRGGEGVQVECNEDLPVQSSARKAAQRYLDHISSSDGICIKIRSKIPNLAGLGSSSADAAAVLIGLNKMHENAVEFDDLLKIGLSVGADVPFCMVGGAQRARGIGEILSPIESNIIGKQVLVVVPQEGVSTVELFSSLKLPTMPVQTMQAIDSIQNGDINQLSKYTYNALYDCALSFAPQMKCIAQTMQTCGALSACMSGSGSSVFGLFDDEDAMNAAHRALSSNPFCEILEFTDKSIHII